MFFKIVKDILRWIVLVVAVYISINAARQTMMGLNVFALQEKFPIWKFIPSLLVIWMSIGIALFLFLGWLFGEPVKLEVKE